MVVQARRALSDQHRSALRRAVTGCVVAHDRLIGRVRAVVATGSSSLDWSDAGRAHACTSYRDFAHVVGSGDGDAKRLEHTRAAHDAFHWALGLSLDEALMHAHHAGRSIDVGSALVVAAEMLRASMYAWMDEA